MKQPPSPTGRSIPYLRIFILFSAWKFLLICLALLTPSPAYDTSTSLVLGKNQTGSGWALVERLCTKLTRWDAIYFVKTAERGYVNEEEWAFGWGYVQTVSGVERVLSSLGITFGLQSLYLHALSGILISNVSHFLSALVLYKSTLLVFKIPVKCSQNMALIATCLHIISPAGLFLSAPYSESLFSLLSYTGTLLCLLSEDMLPGGSVLWYTIATLGSAIIFSISCTVRSNGLLNGFIFLHDFVHQIMAVITGASKEPKMPVFFRIVVLGIGGLIIGMGIMVPQIIAWRDYCTEGNSRPWCSRAVPSIYLFVQDYYWNVGMFRYWTLSNIPLFLLAAPMLTIMVASGSWGAGVKDMVGTQSIAFDQALLRKMVLPQLLLAFMAIVSYHVQIITRLSSGYMVWYWWVAYEMSAGRTVEEGKKRKDWTKWVVRYMVIYGVVQGVLFVGFLPPA